MNDKSEIQRIELGILKEIDKLCKQHDISYFLIGGSMLGAVRHQGFIPWDDDIDIGMLRKDYEKFVQIAESELSLPYKINTYRNDKLHHYYFMHVVNTDHLVRRLGSLDRRIENVWVDIYPIDGFPSGAVKQRVEYLKLQFFRFMYHMGYFEKINLARPGRPLYQRILLAMFKKTYHLFSIDGSKWREKLDLELKRLSGKYKDYYINFIGMQGKRELFKADVFFPLKDYQFEDMVTSGVNNPDNYLTQLYGDWRNPPANKEVHPMEVINE